MSYIYNIGVILLYIYYLKKNTFIEVLHVTTQLIDKSFLVFNAGE